jgi:hypothetical protein
MNLSQRFLGTRNALLRWSLIAIGLLVLSVPVMDRYSRKALQSGGDSQSPGTTRGSGAASHRSLVRRLEARLCTAGWPAPAASKVIDLNIEWFTIHDAENPRGLEIQLKFLETLAAHPTVFPFIENHPEVASLLAGSDDPKSIVEALSSVDGGNYDALASLFVQHTVAGNCEWLASALCSQAAMIRLLQERGVLGAELLFMYERPQSDTPSSEWVQDYDAWLHDELEARLGVPEEELSAFVQLVHQQGPAIRKRLATNDAFRKRFRADFWPRLNRAAAGVQGQFELYLGEERIWDLLLLDEGEELLNRTGLLAIDLLYGYPSDGRTAYPERLRPEVIQILLRQDPAAIQSLLAFRDEPLFATVLEKPISDQTRGILLRNLLRARPNHPALLTLYARLPAASLDDEVGPPPAGLITWAPFYYTVYEVPNKLLQGRDVTAMDMFQAALDPVLLITDVFTAGGAEIGKTAIVAGGKEAGQRVAARLGDKVTVVLLEDRGKALAAKALGQHVAERVAVQAGAKADRLAPWAVNAFLSETRTAVAACIGRATTMEITKPLQFLHRYAGVSGRTIKNLSGLEARVFMRGDARVFVGLSNVPRRLLGANAAEFLASTARDLGIGSAVESEAGHEVIRQVAETALEAKVGAEEQAYRWRQHVSALWLWAATRHASTDES